MMNFTNKKVAVLGWGISGIDSVNYLLSEGAMVSILDLKTQDQLDFSDIDLTKVHLELGENYINNLQNFDYIIRAPGVYRFLPQLLEAQKVGVKITSSIKLFFELCPAKIIGVTGTKGKGTTSTLIYEILKASGKDIYLAGNIGYPVLELLPKLTQNSWVILELSSFQLIDLQKSPHIAVVLNITSDHMDWHKDRGEYIKAKSQIVAHQSNEDFSVINYDYADSKAFEKITKAKVYYFSKESEVSGVYVVDGQIKINVGDNKLVICDTNELALRGVHNWENVCAAVCASVLANAVADSIKSTVTRFKGLEHRLEYVRTIDKVSFYNDSFSTNPQTTVAAIKSFPEPITLILGGSDKGLNYDEMAKEIVNHQNVETVILIGDISEKIYASIINAGYGKKIVKLGKPDMVSLVKIALSNTQSNGIVLLSPATASFDMFKSYKERGDLFKKAVYNLK